MVQAARHAEGERTQSIRRIVIPVGGSDREFLVQEHAVELAGALDVPVAGLHVRADPEETPDDTWAFLVKLCKKWGVEFSPIVLAGTEPAQPILEELDTLDLAVVGTQRLGGRYHLSSLAEALVKEAPCPVQILRLEP